jgi:hypothetical protein
MARFVLVMALIAVTLFATQAFISRDNRREQTKDMQQFSKMQSVMGRRK